MHLLGHMTTVMISFSNRNIICMVYFRILLLGGITILLLYINITFHITYLEEQQTKFLRGANQFLGGGGQSLK